MNDGSKSSGKPIPGLGQLILRVTAWAVASGAVVVITAVGAPVLDSFDPGAGWTVTAVIATVIAMALGTIAGALDSTIHLARRSATHLDSALDPLASELVAKAGLDNRTWPIDDAEVRIQQALKISTASALSTARTGRMLSWVARFALRHYLIADLREYCVEHHDGNVSADILQKFLRQWGRDKIIELGTIQLRIGRAVVVGILLLGVAATWLWILT